jgi:NAD(P)-dependent dehydrogenase (short-subunit alcohol dehydrogenase family)
VIVMSFAAALVGIPFRGAYCASKFALESMFEALRVELTHTGVHVSIIKPGGVATPAANHVPRAAASLDTYRDAREGLTQFFDSAMRNGMPPERVARVILHAATVSNPRARYLVGGTARAIYLGQRLTPTRIADATMTRLLKHNTKGR